MIRPLVHGLAILSLLVFYGCPKPAEPVVFSLRQPPLGATFDYRVTPADPVTNQLLYDSAFTVRDSVEKVGITLAGKTNVAEFLSTNLLDGTSSRFWLSYGSDAELSILVDSAASAWCTFALNGSRSTRQVFDSMSGDARITVLDSQCCTFANAHPVIPDSFPRPLITLSSFLITRRTTSSVASSDTAIVGWWFLPELGCIAEQNVIQQSPMLSRFYSRSLINRVLVGYKKP